MDEDRDFRRSKRITWVDGAQLGKQQGAQPSLHRSQSETWIRLSKGIEVTGDD